MKNPEITLFAVFLIEIRIAAAQNPTLSDQTPDPTPERGDA